MLTREQIEKACKEYGIPVDKFYKKDNELSWGAFRSTKELEAFVKLFSPHLQYEEIKARSMTMEELQAFYDKLHSCKYIIGWFLAFGSLEPRLWYILDEDGKALVDVLGSVGKLISLDKGE